MRPQERLRFSLAWLDCHVALARRLGKPLVLSEFGKRRRAAEAGAAAPPGGATGSHRAHWYQQVRSVGAAAGQGPAGEVVRIRSAHACP